MTGRWARRLLLRLVPADLRDDFAAELEAARADDAAEGRVTDAWYWRQTVAGIAPLLRIRTRRTIAAVHGRAIRRSIGASLWQDARFAVRQWARSPMFFAVSVLTLGLGLGANLAILTIAWQAVLKPLPYPNGDRLVRVWETYLTGGHNPAMPANVRDWQREVTSLERIAAYNYFRDTTDLTGIGEPEQWEVRHVTGDYFAVFGMSPLLGRVLVAADEASASDAVVLSESAWRRAFGGDSGIVGRTIRLGGAPHVVVGVMSDAFEVAGGRVQAWTPMRLPPEQPGQRLTAHYLGVVGRLKPGVSVDRATTEIAAVAARAATLYPDANGKLSAAIESMQDTRGASLRDSLVLLAAAAAAALLAACANLAGVQLARAFERRRELGIRAALGAGRARLMSQLIIENLLLSAAGGAAGLLMGRGIMRALEAVAPETVRVAARAGFDPVILAGAVVLSLAAGVFMGAWPAWRGSVGESAWLRQRSISMDKSGTRARRVLLVTQLALAVVLTMAAAVLGVSLARVLGIDSGVRMTGLVTFDLSFRADRFEAFAARAEAIRSISASIRSLPGVTAACAINELPFDGPNASITMSYVPEGADHPAYATPRNVTAGCLELLGVPVKSGRLFTADERERVAVITERFAANAWPKGDAIGRLVHLGVPTGDLIRVIGVVADSRQASLEARPTPQFYEVFSERSAFPPTKMLVSTASTSAGALRAIREAVRRVEPDQPVARLRPLRDLVSDSTNGRKLITGLTGGFAALVLTLTVVGTFGLMAQLVGQRTQEFGIRLALGAAPRTLVRSVMRQAWGIIAIGLAAGAVGARLSSTLLQGLVFGISPMSLAVLAAVMGMLAVVTLAAAWIPARRAARVDPIGALRTDR